MLQPGISSFAFGWAVGTTAASSSRPFTADALLDFAIAQRVPVMQFGDNLPLHALAPVQLDALAARARQHGVAIETGARGLTSEHLDRYIDVSRRLDARLLRFVIDAQDYEPTVERVVEIIRAALPALRAARLTLGIENHDRFPCATLRKMIDTVGDEHVGVCLDTANSLGAGEGIGEALAQLAPVCVNLHLKDFGIARLPDLMGFTVSGRCLGEGMLPIDRVLATIAHHGRCRSVIVETWPPPEAGSIATLAKEFRWAEQSIAVLREALERLPHPVP